jgi:hypothetical protein
LLESQKVIKGWPSIRQLGWPKTSAELTSMDVINDLLAWFFVAEHREAFVLCDFKTHNGKPLIQLI